MVHTKCCRICKSSENLQGTFEKGNEEILIMLRSIALSPIAMNDHLLQYICHPCSDDLKETYNFQMLYSTTFAKMKNKLLSSGKHVAECSSSVDKDRKRNENRKESESEVDFHEDERKLSDVDMSMNKNTKSFKMSAAIENPASCEVRAVIRFLLAKNHKPIDIYRQICDVYGQGVMSKSRVRQWCIDFKNGRNNVHNEDRSGRPSLVSDELVAKINEKICENHHFTMTELSEHFPQISRSLAHNIVVGKLGYQKICAGWVPKILTEDHKNQRSFLSSAVQPELGAERLPPVPRDKDVARYATL